VFDGRSLRQAAIFIYEMLTQSGRSLPTAHRDPRRRAAGKKYASNFIQIFHVKRTNKQAWGVQCRCGIFYQG
jgi:hypothetical protein